MLFQKSNTENRTGQLNKTTATRHDSSKLNRPTEQTTATRHDSSKLNRPTEQTTATRHDSSKLNRAAGLGDYGREW